MRGADSYNESLFKNVRREDFVPADHPLRPIRDTSVGQRRALALSKMDAKFSAICEADVKGGRPSTIIQAWVSDKSMRRKGGSDDGLPPEDWRGEPRSNQTHQSTSDPESRLYHKRNAAPALPDCRTTLGHVLTDNCLVLDLALEVARTILNREDASEPASSTRRSHGYTYLHSRSQ